MDGPEKQEDAVRTRPWYPAEHLGEVGNVVACLEAAFEDGDSH